MPTFTLDQILFVRREVRDFANRFNGDIIQTISSEFPSSRIPNEVQAFADHVAAVLNRVNAESNKPRTDAGFEIPDADTPILKRALMSQRRALATRLEGLKRKSPHPGILGALEAQLDPFHELIRDEWFRATAAAPIPRLLQFLTLERVAEIFKDQAAAQPRRFDEKFHILLAPDLFLTDLNHYRNQCDIRNRAVSVAFLDIDDFKANFNNRYGEFHVDRYVLPPFMETLESHFFGHGHGYRFGGDEYAVIIPNAELEFAGRLLADFQQRLIRVLI